MFSSVYYFFNQSEQIPVEEISYSEFLKMLSGDKVAEVKITGQKMEIKIKNDNSKVFLVIAPNNVMELLLPRLERLNIKISAIEEEKDNGSGGLWLMVLFSLLPIVFIVWFFKKLSSGGSGGGGGFGGADKFISKINSSLLMEKPSVVFNDVAGCEEAKKQISDFIVYLKNPKKFSEIGAKIPIGALLMGSPGTGKTLLAKALAGEADVPFFSISGSDFVEMFVGVGAARVRSLFESAKKNAPCIIFIDEIDAIGRQRGAGLGGGNDEREQALNQLLQEMDGFKSGTGIIIIAATNRPDILDSALIRSGRFDAKVIVPLPDIKGREDIFKVHLKKIKNNIAEEEIKKLAQITPGVSGADIGNFVNTSAVEAAKEDKKFVVFKDIETVIENLVFGGPELKNRIISEKDKKIAAYHEAGHALVAYFYGFQKLRKITIIPRGFAGGMTAFLPSEEKLYSYKDELLADIATGTAGRVAEEIFFNFISTGAAGDIEYITRLASRMITEFGMSKVFGMTSLGKLKEHPFLGSSGIGEYKISQETKRKIDNEVVLVVSESKQKAEKIINENKEAVVVLAKLLLEKETLDGKEVEEMLKEYIKK